MRPSISSPTFNTLRASLACVLGTLAALTLGACESTQTRGPAPSYPAVLSKSAAAQAWTLHVKGRTVGALVRFEEAATGRFLYSVRDPLGHDRGMVDAEGRAWRFRPHQDPLWTGTGTVAAGVAGILDLSRDPRLQTVALEQLPSVLEASLRR